MNLVIRELNCFHDYWRYVPVRNRRDQGGMQILHEKLDQLALRIDSMVLENDQDR